MKPVVSRLRLRFSALAVTASLAACAGGGASVSPSGHQASSSAGRTAQATFTIKWTNANAPASVRRRDTISPAAQSVTVGINGTLLAIANRTSSPTQSIVLQAPVGTDLFAFYVYDQPNSAGHLIGTASVTQQIVDGAANTVSAAIQALCSVTNVSVSDAHTVARTTTAGSGLLAQSVQSVLLMGQFVTTLAVEPEDVDGDVIITGPGGTVPYTITGGGGTVSVVDGSHIALHPIGGSSPSTPAGTLTVAALGCPSTTIAVKDSPAIYAQAGSAVLVYDWTGNYSGPLSVTAGDVLVGYDSQTVRMIAYNAATGLVSAYDPTLTTRTPLYTTLTSSVVSWSNAIHQIFGGHWNGSQTLFFTYDGTTYQYCGQTDYLPVTAVATPTHATNPYAFATDGTVVYGFSISPLENTSTANPARTITSLATNDRYGYVYAFISAAPYIVFTTYTGSTAPANLPNGFTSSAEFGATDTDQGYVYGLEPGGILEASNTSNAALPGFGLSGPAGGYPAGLVVVSGNE